MALQTRAEAKDVIRYGISQLSCTVAHFELKPEFILNFRILAESLYARTIPDICFNVRFHSLLNVSFQLKSDMSSWSSKKNCERRHAFRSTALKEELTETGRSARQRICLVLGRGSRS